MLTNIILQQKPTEFRYDIVTIFNFSQLMLSYAVIEAFHEIPATIHNEIFVIHTTFYIILHFSLLSFSEHTFKQEIE